MNYEHINTLFRRRCRCVSESKEIKHLLIDLPSVDKEKDDGLLLAHHAFWNTLGELRLDATITEFIYVPNYVEDGTYF